MFVKLFLWVAASFFLLMLLLFLTVLLFRPARRCSGETFAGRFYAHRGSIHQAPPNTLEAIKRAKAAGLSGVEIDVRMSSDGVLVLSHDAELGCMTDLQGQIHNNTYTAIRTARVKGRGEVSEARIPTLLEVLSFASSNNLRLDIELSLIHI